MSKEQNYPNNLELYMQYEKNENRFMLEGSPFLALVAGNIVVGILAAVGNDKAKEAYEDIRIWLPLVGAGIASFPLFIRAADGFFRKNTKIPLKIAQIEGRTVEPKNVEEVAKEEHRVRNTIFLASHISPNLIESYIYDFAQALKPPLYAFFRFVLGASKEKVEEIAKKSAQNLFDFDFKWMEMKAKKRFKDEKTRTEILMTAFQLAKIRWEKIANNPKELTDRREYARLVLAEIEKKLQALQPSNTDCEKD